MRLAAWSAAFALGVAAALGVGIYPGGEFSAPAFWCLGVSAALITVAAAIGPLRKSVAAWTVGPVGALFVVGALLGGMSDKQDALDVPTGVPEHGEAVVLSGVLVEDPAPANNATRLRLRVDAVQGSGGPGLSNFEVDVYASRLSPVSGFDRSSDGFRYGDRYRAEGKFVKRAERERLLVGSVSTGSVVLTGESEGNGVRRLIAAYRQSISTSIRRAIAGEPGALAAALVVGDRRGMSQETTEAYRAAGTAHIIAISGAHITLIGVMATTAAAWAVGRRRQIYLIVPILIVWGYSALAGAAPSVIRAAVMFTVYLAATALGRQRSALPAIGLAACVMIAVSPQTLTSISFQLSFAAMSGIVVIGPALSDWCTAALARVTGKDDRGQFEQFVIMGIATGVAATLATAPLFLFHFGVFATWGTLSTLLALPIVPFLIATSALAALVSAVWPLAGQVAGWPAWVSGEYMNRLSEFFAWLPPGPIEVRSWGVLASVISYLLLCGVIARRPLFSALRGVFASSPRSAPRPRARSLRPPYWLVGTVLLIAAVAWAGAVTARPDGLLRVTFFETSVGDIILIETPNRSQALIDGGRDPSGAVDALGEHLPFWDRSLDLILLTHGDQDHVGGLRAVLEQYEVSKLADAQHEVETAVYRDWTELAGAHGDRTALTGGELIALDDGIVLEVLSAGPVYPGAGDNDSAVVTRLRHGDVSVLFTADIEQKAEAVLAATANLSATAMLAPHHGSNSSSSAALLSDVSPQVVVVSAGTRNSYGHPHDEALARLRAEVSDDRVFITRERGDLTLVTDGKRLWVETAR